MKPYPVYKSSGINWLGKIPEHWSITKLKFVSEIVTGNTPPKSDEENYSSDGYPWIKPDDLNEFAPIIDSKEKLSQKGRRLSRVIPEKSVLLCGIGNIGKFGFSDVELSTNQQINSIVLKNDLLLSRYCLFLISIMTYELVRNSEKVVVSILNKTRQENIKIPLPPISEQNRIVIYLDHKTKQIDTLIEKKQKLIELLKEQRTAIINQAVTKGLDPNAPMKDSGIEWLGDIPEHWEVKKVKHFSTVINGSTPKSSVPEYWDGDIVWITPLDLGKLGTKEIFDSQRKISQDGLNSCGTTITPKGSIVLSTRAPIGHLGLTTVESCTNQGCKTLVPNLHLIDSNYLFYLMYSARDELQSLGQGSTFIELQSQKLKDSKMPLPSLPKQQSIVKKLDEWSGKIETVVEEYKKSINLLKEYRTALISELVTGKIDVRKEIQT